MYRVAFVGNIANNFYREAKALQGSGFEVHLYFLHDPNNSTTQPESDEPELSNGYPDWIKRYPGFKTTALSLAAFRLKIKYPLHNLNKRYIEIFDSYDLCVFSSRDSWFIPFLKCKTIFRATGSDLTVSPLFSYTEVNRLRALETPRKLRFQDLKGYFSWLFSKYISAKSIKSALLVDTGFGKPLLAAASKLSLEPAQLTQLFRLAVDTTVFSKRESLLIEKKWGLQTGKFYVFLPSRVMIRKTPELLRTGQYKGTEKAFAGFKRFLEKLDLKERRSVILLLPKRDNLVDMSIARELIQELNLTKNVQFLEGMRSDALSRDELIQIYSMSSVVLDDFGAGWYGSLVVEALSCEVPVISHVPDDVMSEMFEWHPIQNAASSEDIMFALLSLYRNKDLRSELAIKSRTWVLQYHSNQAIKTRLRSGLQSILE